MHTSHPKVYRVVSCRWFPTCCRSLDTRLDSKASRLPVSSSSVSLTFLEQLMGSLSRLLDLPGTRSSSWQIEISFTMRSWWDYIAFYSEFLGSSVVPLHHGRPCLSHKISPYVVASQLLRRRQYRYYVGFIYSLHFSVFLYRILVPFLLNYLWLVD